MPLSFGNGLLTPMGHVGPCNAAYRLMWLTRPGSASSRIRHRCQTGASSSRFVTPPTTSPACKKGVRPAGMADGDLGADAGGARRPDHDGADFGHEGAEPPCRAAVRSRAQSYPSLKIVYDRWDRTSRQRSSSIWLAKSIAFAFNTSIAWPR
jgi:hypothetical protein